MRAGVAHRLRYCVANVERAQRPRQAAAEAAGPALRDQRRQAARDRLDLVGYNHKEHLYEADHQHFPNMPLVGSENGHSYPNWLAVVRNDYIAGQFLWTGIDYLGEARGWPIHGSGAGLLTVAGFEKHTWHLRRSWWSDEPVAYIVTRPYAESAEKNFWSHPISRTYATQRARWPVTRES
jgi:hypothetical protein